MVAINERLALLGRCVAVMTHCMTTENRFVMPGTSQRAVCKRGKSNQGRLQAHVFLSQTQVTKNRSFHRFGSQCVFRSGISCVNRNIGEDPQGLECLFV